LAAGNTGCISAMSSGIGILTYHLKNSGLKAHALTGCHDEGILA
jgi:hypothetical protein